MGRTIKDVARKARVSIATVSRVMNNQGSITPKTREKVLTAIEALGYTPNYTARRMRNTEVRTISIIVPDISDLFYTGFIRGVEFKANEINCRLIVCNSQSSIEKERDFIRYLYDGSVDGLIFVKPRMPESEINSILAANGSVVVFGGNMHYNNVQSVILDNVSGGYQAVMHFYSHQAIKIAYIGGVAEEQDYDHWARLAGYEKALAECGLPVNKHYLEKGYYTEEGGRLAFHRLMALSDPPEAIFCGNDKIAVGVIKGAQQNGIKIPGQLKLIGFDNTSICQYLTPTLTSFEQPTYQIGALLFEKLMANLNRRKSRIRNDVQVFHPKLLLRESCGCGSDSPAEEADITGSNRIIVNDNVIGTANYQFEYCGMWNYTSEPDAYQGDNHWSYVSNDYCQMVFSGTRLKLYAAKDPRHGIAAICVDDGVEVMIDFFSHKREDNVLLYTSPKLIEGEHRFKLRVTGLKNEHAIGVSINIDRIDVIL